MNEQQPGSNNLVDTTDCLEAVECFRTRKNAFFAFLLVAMLATQVCFWLVDRRAVRLNKQPAKADACIARGETVVIALAATDNRVVEKQHPAEPAAEKVQTKAEEPNLAAAAEKEQIKEVAKVVAAEPNQPAEATPEKKRRPRLSVTLTFDYVARVIRFANVVLVVGTAVYCLTLLFAMKVSLLGRLGGINHIARAFFLSLFFAVLLMPWQIIFPNVFIGVMYTPKELLQWSTDVQTAGLLAKIAYYGRFTGYWLVTLLLLILSQVRSIRWSKSVFRRLEII